MDDGSTDGSDEIMRDFLRRHSNISVVTHSENRGITQAWNSGMQVAKGEVVCFIDADLQHPPEEILRLYEEWKLHPGSLIQGTRSSIGCLSLSRYLISKGLNLLLNLLFGMKATDNKSGFVLAEKFTVRQILNHRFRYKYFHTFIHVSAFSRGFDVIELETLFQERRAGKSYLADVPVASVLWVLFDCFKALFEFRIFPLFQNDLEEFMVTNIPTREPDKHPFWRRCMSDFYFALMPLHAWIITSKTKLYLASLRKSQYLSHEQIADFQVQQLKKLIRHAYYNVPHYRKAMDEAAIRPSDIRSLDDLRRLPMLSKQTLRENLYFDFFASNHDKERMIKVATSGSTGEPLVTYADQKQLEMRFANTIRGQEWTGWRFGDKSIRLWHQTIGMTKIQVIKEKIDALLIRRTFIPAFELNKKNISLFLRKIKALKPVLIDGYAESFNLLARYAQKEDFEEISPKAIMTSAQIMPDHVRDHIEKSFGSEVFDKYGSREFSGIAYECECHEGHHIMAESYIVELLTDNKPTKPGEVGEVVITDLNNYSVPLIRYRIGDLAVAMDPKHLCSCGRGLPKIGKIEGRSQATVTGANGVWLPGTFFSHFFKEFDREVRMYQVIQHEDASIELNIVKESGFGSNAEKLIVDALHSVLGEETSISIRYTEQIPLSPTGKRIPVVSHLHSDFQNLKTESMYAQT